jgi:hypothetical protein
MMTEESPPNQEELAKTDALCSNMYILSMAVKGDAITHVPPNIWPRRKDGACDNLLILSSTQSIIQSLFSIMEGFPFH